MCNTDNELYLLNEQAFEAYLKNEKELAQRAGIEIHQTHGPWRWPVKDSSEGDRAERMKKMVYYLLEMETGMTDLVTFVANQFG